MLRHTLDAMARGGIRDQLGGGFHRYSTDAKWLVPHFEIMLYDNAMLGWVYAEAFRQTQGPAVRRGGQGHLRFHPAGDDLARRGVLHRVRRRGGRAGGAVVPVDAAEIEAVLGAEDARQLQPGLRRGPRPELRRPPPRHRHAGQEHPVPGR